MFLIRRNCEGLLAVAVSFMLFLASSVVCQENDDSKVVVSAATKHIRTVLHQPAIVLITMHNDGPVPVSFDLGDDREAAIVMAVSFPNGTRSVERIRETKTLTTPGKIHLDPGRTYSQPLILDKWIMFSTEGVYRVSLRFDRPAVSANGTRSVIAATDVIVTVGAQNNRDLANFCDEYLDKLMSARTYNEAYDYAQVLAYVDDSIAIPYLRRATESAYPVQSLLITALGAKGTDEAYETLLSLLQRMPQEESGLLKLTLERGAHRTLNSQLRSQIEEALQQK